jgi:putative endonuclease
MPFIYILECAGGSFYTGSAKDLEKRISQHQAGKGAKYTRAHLPVRLIYYEEFDEFKEALKREIQIKRLSRAKKKALIEENNKDFKDINNES